MLPSSFEPHKDKDKDKDKDKVSFNTENMDVKSFLKDLNYFTSSSSLQTIKMEIQIKKKVLKFNEKFKPIVQYFKLLYNEDNVDHTKLKSFFTIIVQSATDYLFIKNEKEQTKLIIDTVCIELLKQFVNDDEKLCRSFICMVANKIKPNTWLRRNKKYVIKVFFLIVNQLLQIK